MNKKNLQKAFFLIVCIFPAFVFAGDSGPGNTLQFLKGDGAFETWFMQVFTTLDTQISSKASMAATLGRAIGGIGALIYMGYLGLQMQEGARPWEVTPMIRPLVIGFILMYWTGFYQLLQAPLQKLAEPSQAIFTEIEKEVNTYRIKRYEKQTEILDALVKKRAEEEAKLDEQKSLLEKAGDLILPDMDQLTAPVKEWFIRMDFQLQKLLSETMESIALIILRVCTYLIFFIQKIWSYVLIILGPIAVGMSLIPGFENSMNNWIAKFININLYTFVAYTIINIGQQLIVAGYQMEIDRYTQLVDDGGVADFDSIALFVSHYGFIHSIGFTIVAYVVTGIGILMTPSIADAVVSAGGAGLMSKAKAGGSAVGGATKAVSTAGRAVAKKGASVAASAGRTISQGIKSIK